MWNFIQAVLNGLSIGSLYALLAVGYSLVYGILQFVNFAHAEFYMLGAYFILLLLTLGAPITVAIPIAMCALGLFAVMIEHLIYKPLRKQHRLSPLITAVGLSLFLQNFIQMVYSPNPQSYPLHLPGTVLELFDGKIFARQRDLGIFSFTLILTGLLHLFFKKTKQGRGIVALAQQPQAAQLVGIPVNRSISVTFFLGAALAVIAGALQGMAFNQIGPYMGVSAGLKAFAAAVLGGIGVLPGALIGGLVLGIAESLCVSFELSTYKDGLAFFILIIVLLIRPQGFFGKARLLKV